MTPSAPSRAPADRAGPPPRRRADERGMAESVQWAMLMPLLVACLVGIVGVCVWLAGRSAAQEAAYAGAAAAAIWDGDPAQASQAAIQVAEGSGLSDVVIVVGAQDTLTTVTVTGRVSTFLPDAFDPRVQGVASSGREPA